MGKYLQQLAEQTGNQVASGAIGGVMGLLTAGWQDKRQLKQQQKLQDMQIKGNKAMMDYSMQKELEMWEKTNYNAQKAQMVKAGLNPALMYGMSGGGGTTIGSPTGSVSGGQAAAGSGEIPTMMGMGMQLALMKAQKENIEADTAQKLSSVPVNNATVPKLNEETKAIQANRELTEIKSNVARIEEHIAGMTQNYMISIALKNSEKAQEELDKLMRENKIGNATKEAEIGKVKAEWANLVTQNTLLNENVKLTREQVKKVGQEIQNLVQELSINRTELTLEVLKTALMKRDVEFRTALSQRTYDNILKGVNAVMGGVKQVNVQ